MKPLTESSRFPTYYESLGTGTPLVFVHPPHMDHTVFHYQRELSKHFKVILYDIRGHGKSSGSQEPTTVSLLAQDLRFLLDELDIDRPVICGYSSGGSVAQQFALTYPDRLSALILSGGFPCVNTLILKNIYRSGIMLVKNGRSRFLSNVLSFSHHVTKQDRHDLYEHCLRANEQTALEFYEDSFRFDCRERLSEIDVPMLLLNGERAFYMRAYLPLYWESVKNVTSVLIEGGNHQIPTKKHSPFNHAIRDFVRSLV